MTTFDVTGTYIFDPIPLATLIENVAAPYLKNIEYKVGAYLKGYDTPLITFDNSYYCKRLNSNGNYDVIPITSTDDINGEIFDRSNTLIMRDGKFLTSTPTVPIRGIKIISAYIDMLLTKYSAWATNNNISVNDIWKEFIKQEYEYTPEVFELIEDLLYDLRSEVRSFIGNDKWIMFFQKSFRNDIIIERTIDYRIYHYCQEHGIDP
jgi:hypothetical protein